MSVEAVARDINVVLPCGREIISEVRVVKHGIMLPAVGKEDLPVFGGLLPDVQQILD